MDMYYNVRCSKCRIAKDFLEKNKINVKTIEYLNKGITKNEINQKLGVYVDKFVEWFNAR